MMVKWCTVAIGLLLLFLMVVFPMTLSLLYVKAALFGAILLLVVASWFATLRIALHPSVLKWALFLACLGFAFSLRGLFAETPGAMKQAQVYGLWPLIYTVLVSGASDGRVLLKVHRVLVAALMAISIYGLVLVLTRLGVLPRFEIVDWLSLGEKQAVGFEDEFLAVKFEGLNSLPFLIPYVLGALLSGASLTQRKLRIETYASWAALTVGLILVIVSGRRALILILLVSPVVFLILSFWEPLGEQRKTFQMMRSVLLVSMVIIACFIWYLQSTYDLTFKSMVDMFASGFNFVGTGGSDPSASLRRQQWFALLEGWSHNPLLGAGHGASAIGSVRSYEMPWAYELYYVALLFQVGIIGCVLYAAAVLWIYWKGAKIISEGGELGRLMFASLAGMTGVLIASATNPYLARFDGLWVIFIPLSIINSWLLSNAEAGCKVASRE